MKTHDRYIKRAIEVASTSLYRWQLGSLIVNNGNVLSWAPNRYRNSPNINHLHATYHAEMAALRRCLLLGQGRDYLRSPYKQRRGTSFSSSM